MSFQLFENDKVKILRSPDYNYNFNKKNGYFERWGAEEKDDPSYSPFGPEILDLEISSGKCSGNCHFCYKQNGINEQEYNMTFEQFKVIFDKMPKVLTQIAYGLCDMHTNPDTFKMMQYAREYGVIPNFTTNGKDVTDCVAELSARLCGALAVSIVDKEKSYNAIKLFSDTVKRLGDKATLKQINIHQLLSMETFEKAKQIVVDVATDPRLKNVNAIVFLQYKHKNPNSPFHSMLDPIKYRELVDHCEKYKVNYGFDSCSCGLFMSSVKDHKNYEMFKQVSEPCESGIFSAYTNCKGVYFPCSFCEEMGEWKDGVDILNCVDFVKDIWNNECLITFRNNLLKNGRKCPMYDI
jgi:hypothetical protein